MFVFHVFAFRLFVVVVVVLVVVVVVAVVAMKLNIAVYKLRTAAIPSTERSLERYFRPFVLIVYRFDENIYLVFVLLLV